MNKIKKTMVVAMTAVVALSAVACGQGSKEEAKGSTEAAKSSTEKTVNGFYGSTQDVGFVSMYPNYTFKQATFGVETIETYEDGTYCLTWTSSNYSGALSYNDDGTHEEVPRGADTFKYYGTYKSEESDGLLTLTLSAPESLTAARLYTTTDTAAGYINTEAWTDDMGAAVAGEDGASMTAEEYLASVSYDETTVIVDTMTDSFDYIAMNPNMPAQQ